MRRGIALGTALLAIAVIVVASAAGGGNRAHAAARSGPRANATSLSPRPTTKARVRTLDVPFPNSTTCYVAAQRCSLTPCLQYTAPAVNGAVYAPTAGPVRASARCHRQSGRPRAFAGATITSAMPSPASLPAAPAVTGP